MCQNRRNTLIWFQYFSHYAKKRVKRGRQSHRFLCSFLGVFKWKPLIKKLKIKIESMGGSGKKTFFHNYPLDCKTSCEQLGVKLVSQHWASILLDNFLYLLFPLNVRWLVCFLVQPSSCSNIEYGLADQRTQWSAWYNHSIDKWGSQHGWSGFEYKLVSWIFE